MANGKTSADRRRVLHRVTSESELDAAIAEIDALLSRRGKLSTADEAKLDQLGDAVREYELLAHPMVKSSPSEILKSLLASNKMTAATLSRRTGVPPSLISAVLKGKASLDRNSAKKIADHFSLRPTALCVASVGKVGVG